MKKELSAGKAVIIGSGTFPRSEFPRYLIESADVVICCDSAAVGYIRHYPDRKPDMIIGDMDSIPESFLKRYDGPWEKVPDQQTNDLTKAFNYLMENYSGLSEIHFIGITGKRVDHTIANLSLLCGYAHRLAPEVMIDAVSDTEVVFPMLDSGRFSCGQGRAVSIFATDSSLKIKSEGLRWKTDEVVFDSWWKASLNKADQDEVVLTFSHSSPVLIVLS